MQDNLRQKFDMPYFLKTIYQTCREKTCFRGFRPGPEAKKLFFMLTSAEHERLSAHTHTEAAKINEKLGFNDCTCTIYVAKKALISCAFVFAYMQKAGFLITRLMSNDLL